MSDREGGKPKAVEIHKTTERLEQHSGIKYSQNIIKIKANSVNR